VDHVADGQRRQNAWMTETEWIEFSQFTANVYHKIVRDLLDDSEIRRETDRDATPHVERWGAT
jgi:hypothetical protein